MTWVALAEAAAIVVLLLTFDRRQASQQRAHSRREDLLVNQLLHATGRTWQPAPADRPSEERPDPWAPIREATWTATPEQLPID